MGHFRNAKEYFYDKLNKEKLEIDCLYENNEYGFFELCKLYADIGLNAKRIVCENPLNIKGIFNDEDKERAKNATVDYINANNIEKVDLLMQTIKTMHMHAVEWDDARKESWRHFTKDNEVGIWHSPKKLPPYIFEDIYKDIVK